MTLDTMEIKMRMNVKTKNGVWKNTLSRKDKKRYIKLFNLASFRTQSLSNAIEYEECGIINKFEFGAYYYYLTLR